MKNEKSALSFFPQSKPKNIVLSFDCYQGKYIKSLPLHESQEILVDNENELRIKLKLAITEDLIIELLSYGSSLKVIKPKSLADIMKNEYKEAFEKYHG